MTDLGWYDSGEKQSHKARREGSRQSCSEITTRESQRFSYRSTSKSSPPHPTHTRPQPRLTTTTQIGIIILAADISPMDVISHIPVLCEDHGIPYLYVPSRAELGAAGSTKRPTSVVMVTPSTGKAKEGDGETDKEAWMDTYKELHKLSIKLGQYVKV